MAESARTLKTQHARASQIRPWPITASFIMRNRCQRQTQRTRALCDSLFFRLWPQNESKSPPAFYGQTPHPKDRNNKHNNNRNQNHLSSRDAIG